MPRATIFHDFSTSRGEEIFLVAVDRITRVLQKSEYNALPESSVTFSGIFGDMREMVNLAKTNIEEEMIAQGESMPGFTIFKRTGVTFTLRFRDMPTGTKQWEIALRLARMVRENNVDACYFWNEYWFAVQQIDQPFVLPSQRPDRREGVMIAASMPDHNHISTFETMRNSAGKVDRLERDQSLDRIANSGQPSISANPFHMNPFTLERHVMESGMTPQMRMHRQMQH